MLQTQGLKTLDDLRAFLAGSQGVEIRTCEREACYAFVGQTLKCFGYRRLGKAEKGLVRAYLGKVTGLSRAQLTRLVRRAQAGEALRDRRGPPAMPFARRYTPADVRLLAEVDALHGNLSGAATRKLCERAWEVFGDARYERLAGISNGHLYNLRGSQTYQRCRGRVDKTRAVQVRIGERRRPRPEGRPGFLRVDSVHQGDLDGVKGLYHINLVDEVTQFQFVGSVERISEHFLLPVLAALLAVLSARNARRDSDRQAGWHPGPDRRSGAPGQRRRSSPGPDLAPLPGSGASSARADPLPGPRRGAGRKFAAGAESPGETWAFLRSGRVRYQTLLWPIRAQGSSRGG